MILAIADIKHIDVKAKVTADETYIDDDVVRDMYYHPLADKFGVDTDYLPDDTSINNKVKRYLALSVYITVANDNVGADMTQVIENITLDYWVQNKIQWQSQLDLLLASMSASDIYDPDNIPEDETENSSILTIGRS